MSSSSSSGSMEDCKKGKGKVDRTGVCFVFGLASEQASD